MVESIVGDGITYSDQLEKLGKKIIGDKFLGVFLDGEPPEYLKDNECVIINRKMNQHWVACININDNIYTYDSFDRKNYLGGYGDGDYDGIPDQEINESNCGQRSLAYLITTLSNVDLFRDLVK